MKSLISLPFASLCIRHKIIRFTSLTIIVTGNNNKNNDVNSADIPYIMSAVIKYNSVDFEKGSLANYNYNHYLTLGIGQPLRRTRKYVVL